MYVRKQVLGVSCYSCEDRKVEYQAVGRAYAEGYTEVLQDKGSDEVVYLARPEDLDGTVLDHLDEETLEASLCDYFEVVDLYEWVGLSKQERSEVAHWTTRVEDTDNRGKVEEVDEHTLPLLTFED